MSECVDNLEKIDLAGIRMCDKPSCIGCRTTQGLIDEIERLRDESSAQDDQLEGYRSPHADLNRLLYLGEDRLTATGRVYHAVRRLKADDSCPSCGGPADNGSDRCVPPSPYNCRRCDLLERAAIMLGRVAQGNDEDDVMPVAWLADYEALNG